MTTDTTKPVQTPTRTEHGAKEGQSSSSSVFNQTRSQGTGKE